ncbi:MAG: hypothetical protein U1E65_30845 [Myxococcota bacterium]
MVGSGGRCRAKKRSSDAWTSRWSRSSRLVRPEGWTAMESGGDAA